MHNEVEMHKETSKECIGINVFEKCGNKRGGN